MDLGIGGKVAVVTGASRGIGLAVVRALLAEGVKVVAGARDVGPLAELDVVAVAGDLATAAGPARLIEAAAAAHGGVDFLVNNAGAGRLHFDGFAAITDEDWTWSFETNFLSAVRATRAAIAHLVERRGAIVTVSSGNARSPSVHAPEYSAMKAALNNAFRALALELAPRGVRVNTISPGPVSTDIHFGTGGFAEQLEAQTGDSVAKYRESVEKAVPLGRWGQPEEIATVVLMLLSGRAAYLTGADVAVDGAL